MIVLVLNSPSLIDPIKKELSKEYEQASAELKKNYEQQLAAQEAVYTEKLRQRLKEKLIALSRMAKNKA